MVWTLAFRDDYGSVNSGDIVHIPIVFTSTELVVVVEPDRSLQTVGYLKQISFQPILGDVVLNSYQLRIENQLLDMSLYDISNYKLNFVPSANFKHFRLSIWKSNMPLTRSMAVGVSQASEGHTGKILSSTDEVELLVANPSRKGASIINNSTATLYIRFDTLVGPTSDTLQLGSNGYSITLGNLDYYELPFGFTGVVYGKWSAQNGAAFVTEFV